MSKPPLPTSAADVNPSDIRKDPLSLDELRKIKSLIDVAKGSGASSSCKPLTGRRVMVPITSKAFFEGVLQPPSGTNAGSPSAAEEQLVVNVGGGQLQEMTRVEACKYIDKQLGVLDKSNRSQIKKTKSKSTGLKKGFLNNTKNKPKPSDKKSTSPQNKTEINEEILSQQEAMFPLMEIREECDERGNIVNSEVINMSNTMKRIDDRLKNGGDIAEASGDGDGEKLGKLLADTLKESEADITTGIDKIDLNDEEEVVNDIESAKQVPVSDEDYETILQRLEELERLEEEDAKSKMVNKTSSKRLQSGGWSKGFLNNTKKTSTKKTQNEKKQVKVVDEDVKTIPSTRSTTHETQPRNNSRVSFSSKNQVKEIPRIGLNKVPQKPIPTKTTAGTIAPDAIMESSSGLDPFTPRSTVPFEDNVFRGVVKERNSSTVRAKDQTPQDTTGERKKLSRFAQRRLQRE